MNDWGAPGFSSDRSLTYTLSIEKLTWAVSLAAEGLACGSAMSANPRRENRGVYPTVGSDAVRLRRPGGSAIGRQQRVQAAGAVERHEIVVAADVGLPDVD